MAQTGAWWSASWAAASLALVLAPTAPSFAQDAAEAPNPDAAAKPPAEIARPAAVSVRGAAADGFSRISFNWPAPVAHKLDVDGVVARVSFNAEATFDLAETRAGPPPFVKSIEAESGAGRSVVLVTMADGARPRVWAEGARIVLDVQGPLPEPAPADITSAAASKPADAPTTPPASPPPKSSAPAIAASAPAPSPPAAPTPIPQVKRPPPSPQGIVRPTGAVRQGGYQLSFAFQGEVPAAAFQHAGALYVAFGAPMTLDAGAIGGVRGYIDKLATIAAKDIGLLQIEMAPGRLAALAPEPGGWRLDIRANVAPTRQTYAIARVPEGLRVSGGSFAAPIRVKLPQTGDDVVIAPAFGPVKAITDQRNLLQVQMLPTLHGVVLARLSDGIDARPIPDGLVITARDGLVLTPSALAELGGDRPLRTTHVDFAAWRPGQTGLSVYDELAQLARSAANADPGPDGTEARLDYVRGMIGAGLAHEALGLARVAEAADVELTRDAHFMALKLAAQTMVGRYQEALATASASGLREDPSAALWRGFARFQIGDWAQARIEFANGVQAFSYYTGEWRDRFAATIAEAALIAGDLATAEQFVGEIPADAASATRGVAEFVTAEIARLRGDGAAALTAFAALERHPYGAVALRALIARVDMQRKSKAITAERALDELSGAQFLWRGDGLEAMLGQHLGEVYADLGRYREALSSLWNTSLRNPDTEAARQLRIGAGKVFEDLFLRGGADRLDPVQAVGLFYEFRDLTPLGGNGDIMTRRLVDRLIAFDLLTQAAELLSHQTFNRAQGLGRAKLAADLAAVYLFDNKPDKALEALQTTRQPGYPEEILRERRLLEAAALSELGRPDHALELLDGVAGAEAQNLRAEIHWRAGNWRLAAQALMTAIGDPPAIPDQNAAVTILRAAIAANLADDESLVRAIAQKYGAAMARSIEAEAFRALVEAPDTNGARVRDLAARLADSGAFEAFIGRLRERVGAGDRPA